MRRTTNPFLSLQSTKSCGGVVPVFLGIVTIIRRCKARGVLDSQNPFVGFVCYQWRRVPIVNRQERMSPIISILRAHQVQTFADRWKERAILFQKPCQHIKPICRQIPKAIVIFGNQPFFSLHVASIFALEQNFPSAECFKKCPLVLDRSSQALRRLLLRGCYARQRFFR